MDKTLYLFAGAIFGLIIGGALANRFKGYHSINFKLNQIMATLAEFQAAFSELQTIAARLRTIADTTPEETES